MSTPIRDIAVFLSSSGGIRHESIEEGEDLDGEESLSDFIDANCSYSDEQWQLIHSTKENVAAIEALLKAMITDLAVREKLSIVSAEEAVKLLKGLRK